MSAKVLASSGLSVNTGVSPLSTGSEENGLPRVFWVSGDVMNLTNWSAASLFLVFLKIDMLMPAMKVAIFWPPVGAGKGTTPYSSLFIPLDWIELSALFWLRIIATFFVAKSFTALVPLSSWALASLVNVGLPALSNHSPPFWLPLMKAKWTFSV